MTFRTIADVWRDIDLGERLHPYEEEMFPGFCRIARDSNRVLEIGVGRGRMAKILKANGVEACFYCVDLVPEYATGSPGHGVVSDTRALPFKEDAFDLTYSLGVVEHFPETRQAIQEHARVTRKGGYVLVTTPHQGIATLVRFLLFYTKLKRECGTSFEVLLGRNMSLSQIRQYCRDAGLEPVKASASGPIIPASNITFQRILNLIPLPSSKFGAYLFCLARKPRLH